MGEGERGRAMESEERGQTKESELSEAASEEHTRVRSELVCADKHFQHDVWEGKSS